MILQIKDTYDKENDKWVIELEGEADVYTVNNLKERLNQLLEERMINVEIDCTSLHYIDSTGLGALIGVRGKLSGEGKNLALMNTKPNVRKLLKITGLDKIFVVE